MNKKPKNPIRVAFLGMGWVARKVWLPILLSHNGFLPYLCCDPPNQDTVELVHSLYPAIDIAGTPEEIISSRPDLVWITTPNNLHSSQAIFFLERNISVFVEKPVCIKPTELAALAAAVQVSDACLFPSQASLMRHDVQMLIDQIRQGAVGKIRLLEISWVRGKGIPTPGSWFTRKRTAGGGVGFDLGWHMLDVGLGLLDYPQTRNSMAFAFHDHIGNSDHHQADWHRGQGAISFVSPDVEDSLWAMVETEIGQGIHLHVAWVSDESLDKTSISVYGTKGKLELITTFGFSPHRIQLPYLVLKQSGAEKTIRIPREPLGTEYHRQVSAIHRFMLEKSSQTTSFIGISAVFNCISSIYDSLRT